MKKKFKKGDVLVVKSLNKGRNTGINWMNRADLGIGDIALVITNWEKDMPFDVDVQFELPERRITSHCYLLPAENFIKIGEL